MANQTQGKSRAVSPSAEAGATTRDRLLAMTDDELLVQCRMDRFRGTGRGGQKRNVTDSAVRLTLTEYEISAQSDATRSQIQNRRKALRLLRAEIALRWRAGCPAKWEWGADPPSPKAQLAPLWTARALDVIEGCDLRIGDAAKLIGTSTGRLVRWLSRDPHLWQHVNDRRRQAGLTVLRK